nr:hypothetical protein BaRGS_008024 [Batillaria attramentaria]
MLACMIKRAERIDRKLEAEKSKLKRKVLKTETLKKVTLAKENANQTACLQTLAGTSPSFPCPACRAPVIVPPEGVGALQN